ncbi:MAG TPA: hypothetical protein DD473_27930 [Planctomycetaceae bacterium]|nr:hypothetical protein [Planctomycetaceae bacterium]
MGIRQSVASRGQDCSATQQSIAIAFYASKSLQIRSDQAWRALCQGMIPELETCPTVILDCINQPNVCTENGVGAVRQKLTV